MKPGDTESAPTHVFEYNPGDPVRKLVYYCSLAGDLLLSVTGDSLVTSQVTVRSRETAGGGTFDIVQITDGAGHKLGTIEEGENAGEFIYKDVKRYTSRGTERDSYLPFLVGASVPAGSPSALVATWRSPPLLYTVPAAVATDRTPAQAGIKRAWQGGNSRKYCWHVIH